MRLPEVLARATAAEVAERLPGDELVTPADVVMDRAFTLDAPPEEVWPWLVQLGKRRAGWYLPRWVERAVPSSRRGLRRLEPRWQSLSVGDVIPDWGGRDATFTVAAVAPDRHLVHRSRRGRTRISWCLALTSLPGPGGPGGSGGSERTRLHLRLRMAPVRHRRLAEVGGGLVDLLTVAGLAAGLRERTGSGASSRSPSQGPS